MCLATAFISFRGPRIPDTLLLPSVCLAAILFVLAFAFQSDPYASRCLLVLGATATGLVLRPFAVNPSNQVWIAACGLASLAMVSITAFVLGLARAGPAGRSTRETRTTVPLLSLAWAVTVIYALAWAALAVFELPLVLQASVVALGVTLFLGLGTLLIVGLSDRRPPDGLRAELGLYLCWLNLALLGLWIAGHRAMLSAAN